MRRGKGEGPPLSDDRRVDVAVVVLLLLLLACLFLSASLRRAMVEVDATR